MDSRYLERRRELEARFATYRLNEKEREIVDSPSGEYRLTLDYYSTGPNSWDYSRGRVTTIQGGRIIADIKRNYGRFWYSWINHANGSEYLLCGEDYQGQTVVNLSSGQCQNYFPEAGFDGHGFCWAAAYPSSDSRILAIEGCYWACPYEVVFLDFSSPDNLPYKELSRIDALGKCVGWLADGSFELTQEIEVRVSDGRPYLELSGDEQGLADRTPGSLQTIGKSVIVERKSIA